MTEGTGSAELQPSATAYPRLRLKKREERRLRAGHLWVYSNEIDTRVTPLKGLVPGQPVVVESHHGRPLAMGYANPGSLIAVRVISRRPEAVFDAGLIRQRLERALQLREALNPRRCYRWVFGESDRLPGLVVDRYQDYCSVQITTAGMEAQKEEIVSALDELCAPRGIVWRNDSPMRELEGLPQGTEVQGEVPEFVEVLEQDARFEVSLSGGQKTGWFYDQADNRTRMQRYVRGQRVLDLFSYVGAWGVRAALAGAEQVLCVDVSAEAVAQVRHNAALNGVQERIEAKAGDVFDTLKQLRGAGERFDVVITDPPAFVKRKKDLDKGSEAYQRLNHQALELLAEDGMLITASCSYHMPAAGFQRAVARAAHQSGRELQILERGGQAVDHPIHPAMPETEYLKALFCRVTRT